MGRGALSDVRVGRCLVREELNIVIRCGEEIRLEPKAMEVLAMLLERPGEVVDRREILRRVWQNSFVCDEVLTNVVSQLRRAFRDDPRRPAYIQTIVKRGYRLIAKVERPAPRASGPSTEAAARLPVHRRMFAAAGVALTTFIGAFAWTGACTDHGSDRIRSGSASTIETIAVGTFQPVLPNPNLLWLETAIPDLMAASLSQASGIRVLEPSRQQPPPNDEATQIVVDGTFLPLKGKLRITVHASRRSTGELLVTESVDGGSPDEIFEMIASLAARTATRLDLVRQERPHLSRALRDVTTDSIDAYRSYVDGLRAYYEELDDTRALEHFTRAVEIDPSFAMAAAKLVVMHMNFGEYEEADRHARRALEHVGRLAEHQRHYVTGNFYVTREEHFDEALAAYRRALTVDPDHVAARHNVGYILFRLERYREALSELEHLIDAGVAFPGTYRLAMMSYAALGEFESGRKLAMRNLSRHPTKWVGRRDLAQHLMRWGKLHDARRELALADSIQPASSHEYDWWQLDQLLGTSRDSGRSAGFGRRLHSPVLGPAMKELQNGRVRRALSSLASFRDYEGTERLAPLALNLTAAIHQETGADRVSLSAVEDARRIARGNAPEWESMFLAARAHARMGDFASAHRIAGELERRTASIPSYKERRRLHFLRGELALTEGKVDRAIDELEAARGLLPPRGFVFWKDVPTHVPIWYALGEAYRAAERPDDAMGCYRRIVDSTTERLSWPISYVRSFYRLAELHEARGDSRLASANYRKFLDHWEHGEVDRERVNHALTRVASLAELSVPH